MWCDGAPLSLRDTTDAKEPPMNLPMPFRADVDTGALVVVKLLGELDLAAVHHLRAMERRLGDVDSHVVFDLEGLEFVDVAGMRALVTMMDRLRSSGCVVGVSSAPRSAENVADLVGASDHLRETAGVG